MTAAAEEGGRHPQGCFPVQAREMGKEVRTGHNVCRKTGLAFCKRIKPFKDAKSKYGL